MVCLLVGFTMAGGRIMAMVHPAEYITIVGASFGAMLISAPKKIIKMIFAALLGVFKGHKLGKAVYLDALVVMFKLFALAKKQGVLALEAHVADPHKSDIISKYPMFAHHHHAVEFLTDALRLVIDGVAQPEELEPLLDVTLDTHRAEAHMPVNILTKVGDALPGIGIVGAVLGIIITMGAIDGPASEVGHKVAAALVGTFLGVFLSYCLINPIVTSLEQAHVEEEKFLDVIKTGVLTFVSGATPSTAVEYARRGLFSFDRPTLDETTKACKESR